MKYKELSLGDKQQSNNTIKGNYKIDKKEINKLV